jgi:hypothetical protein
VTFQLGFDGVVDLQLDASDASTTSKSAFDIVSMRVSKRGSQKLQSERVEDGLWLEGLHVPDRRFGWGK